MRINFEDYNASYITPQKTLLQKFNKLENFLKGNDTNLFLHKLHIQKTGLNFYLDVITTTNDLITLPLIVNDYFKIKGHVISVIFNAGASPLIPLFMKTAEETYALYILNSSTSGTFVSLDLSSATIEDVVDYL